MPERPNTHTYVVVFWQTSVTYSVTRFGEISPLWQNFKSFWAPFWLAYYVIGKPLYLPTLTFLCYRVNFFAVKDQRLNNSNMVTLVTYLIGAPRFVRKHWVLIHRGFDQDGSSFMIWTIFLKTHSEGLQDWPQNAERDGILFKKCGSNNILYVESDQLKHSMRF